MYVFLSSDTYFVRTLLTSYHTYVIRSIIHTIGARKMALWDIYYEDGKYAGYRNSGETAEQAVAEWNEDAARPLYQIRFHEELPQRGVVRNLNASMAVTREGRQYVVFCDFHPRIRPATKAIRMREIWIDAGYAKVPWVEPVKSLYQFQVSDSGKVCGGLHGTYVVSASSKEIASQIISREVLSKVAFVPRVQAHKIDFWAKPHFEEAA